MSLRSIGNQLLQTAPSTLLAGASTASLSFWVRVNAGCNVANANGVEIFGDAGGKLSATLSGTGSLKLGWMSQNGSTNGSSSYGMTLAPGTSYHLATIRRDGVQQYYLNGVQVHADTQVGLIGVVGDSSPHPFRLGSDSAGTDVTIDEPTIWVGYALSAQDVLNLRDRAVHPLGIAPSSIVLRWSLAGPDGVTALVGDAGLADGSATALHLSSIVGTATYQAGDLSYKPPARVGTASIAPSGQALALVFEDSSDNPTNVVSLRSSSDRQTLSLAGLPAGGTFTLAFQGQTTAPIPVATNLTLGHGLWTIPVIAGQAYNLAVPVRLFSYPTVLHRVYDGAMGATLLFSGNVNEYSGSDFIYGLRSDGTAMAWLNVATVTPSGTTLTILITAPAGRPELINLDALYVQKVSDSSITVYDNLDPVCSHGGGYERSEGGSWHGSFWAFNATGNENTYSIRAADVQSALLALSSVQAGGLTVASSDNVNFDVSFAGPMRNTPQSPITSSDSAITVAQTITGGDVPSIRVNGGSPVPLLDWEWGITNAPALPYAYCPFRQAARTPQSVKVGSGLANYTGPGWVVGNGGYSGITFYSNYPGDVYRFPCQGLTPGTYQLAVTWTTGLTLPYSGAFTSLSNTARFLVQDSSGATLATVVIDQTHAPADFTDDGVGWHILGSYTIASPANELIVVASAAGSINPVAADGVRLARTSADDSLKILPTDSVTMSIPAGWASTSAGAIGAMTNAAVTNRVGQQSFVPFVSNPKTLKVGYNVEGDTLAELIYRYSNLANRVQGPLGLTYDANQYPLTSVGPTIPGITIVQQSPINSGMNGYYTILWDGAIDDISIEVASTTVTEVVGLRNLTRTANNRRVFNIQAIGNDVSPAFGLAITSGTRDPADLTHTNYLHDIQNLRIYPPDPSDATGLTWWQNPPKFHPNYTGTMLAGVQSMRFMDSLATNDSGVHDYDDFIPSSRLGHYTARRIPHIPVSDYRAYSGSDPALDSARYVIVQITTTIPHGLADGQVVVFQGSGTVTLSNGVTYPAANAGSNVRVLSPTVLLLQLQTNIDTTGVTMANVLSGGVVATTISGGSGMTFTDCIELANTVSSVTDIWLNIPIPASDACVTAMGTYVARNLKAGCKVHVEFSNETWNPQFFNWAACCALTRVLGLGSFQQYQPGYVYRSRQVHDLFTAAMGANGRSADVIRTFGAWATLPGSSTVGIMAAAIAQGGVQIDEIATSPYFSNGMSYEPSLQYLYDLHTTDQDLDMMSLNFMYDGYFDVVATQHRKILDANGYTSTRIVGYEAGPTVDFVQPSTANTETRNRAINRHPRMYWAMLQFLQGLQDKGMSLVNIFYVAGQVNQVSWSTWFNWNQQPGTGDPTLDALNVSNPEAPTGVKSQVGGAMKLWASLVAGPSTTPPAPKRSMPGRNGLIKATGYPRGMFRPTR